MEITVEMIKSLRTKTGLGVHDIKKALEATAGDEQKAMEWLKEKGLSTAAKKADRATSQGLIHSYIHAHRMGAMVEVNCETDFVSRNDEFKAIVHDIAMQVASMNPENIEELLKQDFFKEPSKTIEDYLKETIAKIGENIKISRIVRFELGE